MTTRPQRFQQAGFSLIELMVGLAIGLLAVIVILQVMSVFEAQRRTTTGSADAQTNGGIALYAITRELQMAGYPLLPSLDSAQECKTLTNNILTPTPSPAAYAHEGFSSSLYGINVVQTLSPVLITDGIATSTVPASDSITIRYGNTQMGGTPTQISFVNVATKLVTVESNQGCKTTGTGITPDVALLSSGTDCYLTKATTVPGDSTTTAKAATTIVLDNVTGAADKVYLACLGSWVEATYSVNQTTGNLERVTRVNGAALPAEVVVTGVVNMQAQYGVSAAASSNTVTTWVDATGSTWGPTVLTVANRNRIKAIRIALVSRNEKQDPDVVSGGCSSTTAATPTGLCAWEGKSGEPAPAVDLSPGNANWARYRYRVFEAIIPLRNVIWAKDTL